MSQRTGRHGGGGRTGQHHRKTPQLRSYDVPPASDVTVSRPDGTEEILPAKKPKAATTRKRPKRRDLIKKQDKRRSAEPVPIERVRAAAADDDTAATARAAAKSADAAALAARGLRAIPAAAAVSRHGGGEAKRPAPAPAGPVDRQRAPRRKPARAKQPLLQPPSKNTTRRQMLSVACPTCKAEVGAQCSMPVGHRTRVEAFFASVLP